MEMLDKVRRMHLRDKLSLYEVSKRTRLSRNTLCKWLRQSAADVVYLPRYRRLVVSTKLTPYHATLALALKADSLRINQNRRTGKALFLQIQAEGYTEGLAVGASIDVCRSRT